MSTPLSSGKYQDSSYSLGLVRFKTSESRRISYYIRWNNTKIVIIINLYMMINSSSITYFNDISLATYIGFNSWWFWWPTGWHCELSSSTPIWEPNQIFRPKAEIVCSFGNKVFQNVFSCQTWQKKGFSFLDFVVYAILHITFIEKYTDCIVEPTLGPNSSSCFIPILHGLLVLHSVSFDRQSPGIGRVHESKLQSRCCYLVRYSL